MSNTVIKIQRDQAVACFTLSMFISAAVFVSVFGKASKLEIERAQRVVSVHEELLKQSAGVLQENQSALNAVRIALEKIEHSQKR